MRMYLHPCIQHSGNRSSWVRLEEDVDSCTYQAREKR